MYLFFYWYILYIMYSKSRLEFIKLNKNDSTKAPPHEHHTLHYIS